MKKAMTSREKYLALLRRNKLKVRGLQIALLVFFIGVWELTTAIGLADSFFVSSPSRIVKTLVGMAGVDLMRHVGITLLECVLGFLISTAVGIVVAVALWWSETARAVSEPYLVVLNALPKIALGPIIIIWAGAGMKAIVTMAFLICIIVTVMSLLSAFTSTDEGKVFLLKSMGATRWQILLKLVIPSSVPAFMSLMKINVGLSWVGTIMGEYLVSGAGLGYLIIYGGQVFKIDLVMAATVILCVLAAAMYGVVALIGKLFARYEKQ